MVHTIQQYKGHVMDQRLLFRLLIEAHSGTITQAFFKPFILEHFSSSRMHCDGNVLNGTLCDYSSLFSFMNRALLDGMLAEKKIKTQRSIFIQKGWTWRRKGLLILQKTHFFIPFSFHFYILSVALLRYVFSIKSQKSMGCMKLWEQEII